MALPVKLCRLHLGFNGNLSYFKLSGTSKLNFSTSSKTYRKRRLLWTLVGAGSAVGLGVVYALENTVKCGDYTLHPFKMPWSHAGIFESLDMKSVRRGYEVYKQVCAACHSIRFVHYRDFVDVFMTAEEAKAEAAEATVVDGPDDQGKMYERPGKLFDFLPKPYANNKEAAFKNNGAIPPDLTLITLARHGAEDYVFSILTGYQEAPAGVKLGEGQAYNPYFIGGALSMPQQLFDEMLEYEDGTPATTTQLAKDVTTFLKWCAEPEHDIRKLWALKLIFFSPVVAILLLYWKRHIWSIMKTHKIVYRTLPGRQPPVPKE